MIDMKLHIYAQQLNHDSAWIVGDRQALYELRHAIDLALEQGSTCLEFEVADGETYALYVVELETKEMTWEQVDLPYTDRSVMGFKNARPPSPPYGLLSSARHKELRAKLLKDAEKTVEVPVLDTQELSIGEYRIHAGSIPTESFKVKARVKSVNKSTAYDGPSLVEYMDEDEDLKRR